MATTSESGERTEAATARRLQRARDEGQVAISRELSALAVLGGLLAVLLMRAPNDLRRLLGSLAAELTAAGSLDGTAAVGAALRQAGMAMLLAALPFMLAAMVSGVAISLLQTGLLLNLSRLMPDFARVDPRAGLARVLGAHNLAQAGISLLKLAIIGAATWRLFGGATRLLAQSVLWPAPTLVARLGTEIVALLISVAVAQTVIATLDVVWVRLRQAGMLRMSRQDIKDEAKDSDGDPRIKARLRQLRAQRARRRMVTAVQTATVVVTNPTHYAVALSYDRARNAAPRVVAKGMDEMAARIRAVAEEHKVPIVANPPLARALHLVELDSDIPAEHYQAVAELIAYVWRLQGQVRRQRAAAERAP